MIINSALIFCAGLGKRLIPLTLQIPKPLLELNNITILERCIEMVIKCGIKKIFINTFHLGNQISKYSYAGSANSTDVGDMVYYNIVAAGNHV